MCWFFFFLIFIIFFYPPKNVHWAVVQRVSCGPDGYMYKLLVANMVWEAI